MEETFVPLRGIKNDLQGRLRCYKQDWSGGFNAGVRYSLLKIVKITSYMLISFQIFPLSIYFVW